MAIPYSQESDKIFVGLIEHLDILRAISVSENEPKVTSAIDTLKTSLMALREALVESSARARQNLQQAVEEDVKDDPWAKILLHRKL